MAQADVDRAWREDGEKNGWCLPPKAAWPLRIWGVRFIRAMILDYRIYRWAAEFARYGVGLGPPSPRDVWIVYAVARGWC